MKQPSLLRKIPLIYKIGYGAGNLGVGVAMQVIGAYLVFFATVILGIPGSLAGLAVGISVFWDAVTDPVAGYLSDRTRTRFGRRRPWMLASALPVGLTYFAIWAPPGSLSGGALSLWIAGAILLFYSAMTVFNVPYTA
ncbi:MAG: MFS transporter, partial [Erysipelotrichales bacterium]